MVILNFFLPSNEHLLDTRIKKIYNAPRIWKVILRFWMIFFYYGKDMKRKISNDVTQISVPISIEASDTQKKMKCSHDNEIFQTLTKSNLKYFVGNHDKKNKYPGPFKIYSLSNIQNLIQKEQESNKKPSKKIKLRFILTKNFELYFAEEGAASTKIPSHGNMTGCLPDQAIALSAGNIGFNEKGEMNFFSNKSGDFRPSWDSGQLSLAILFHSKIAMATEITLEKFSFNGRPDPKFTVNSFELREEIEDKIPLAQREKWLNSNLECPDHTYFYDPERGPAEYDPLVHDTKPTREARPYKQLSIRLFDTLAACQASPAEKPESPIKQNGLFARFLDLEADESYLDEENDKPTEASTDHFSITAQKSLSS